MVRHFLQSPGILARVLAGQRRTVVRAVDGVDLAVLPGETLGLVGESGCGKTTLGRVLVRLYEPTSGEVLYEGRSVRERKDFHRAAQIIFQNPYASLNPRKTVREILDVPLRHRGVHRPVEREAEAMRLLTRVGLAERHIDSYPVCFSIVDRHK